MARVDDAAGFAGVQALVWSDGAPAGWIAIPVSAGRCSAEAITGALAPLSGNDPHDVPGDPEPWPTVTVAVCTRDRTADLERCLVALAAVRYPALELLVVDNAPASDLTEQLVRRHGGSVRYVREVRPGSTGRGTARSGGNRRHHRVHRRRRHRRPGLGPRARAGVRRRLSRRDRHRIGGSPRVGNRCASVIRALSELCARVRPPPRLAAGGGSVAARYGATGDFGTGANMAFRRKIFDRIGPFDPALDVGTLTRGGGDLEMFFRVLKEGYTLVYEPRALVRHRHRRDLLELRSQMTDHGIGFSSYLMRTALKYPRSGPRLHASAPGGWRRPCSGSRVRRPRPHASFASSASRN